MRLEATDEATAFMVYSMMRGGMERGNVAGLAERMVEKPFTGAGKSGTTHDFSDTWFLGYNGRVSCGVWVGFLQPNKSIYDGAFSKDLAMPVWEDAMNTAAANYGGKIISQPDSVVQAEICRVSGQRATPYCYDTFTDAATGASLTGPAKIQEYFRKGSENLPFCPLHSGAAPADAAAVTGSIIVTAVIDTTPVRSKEPVLLGEDPYYTEQVILDGTAQPAPRNRTNVLDSFDLGDGEVRMKLPWPERLKIDPE